MEINYKKRIFGLDIMRTTAILFVLFSHTLWLFSDSKGFFVDIIELMGVMGVEIFFVLSGFLIGNILFKIFTNKNFKKIDLFYFLIRRWFRTLPNYYLILIINILIVIFLGRDLPKTIILYFFFLQNSVFEMDIFFTESWSLPIEEFAYIICPLLLYLTLFVKSRISKQKLFLFITLFVITFFLTTKVFYNNNVEGITMNYWNTNLKAVVLYRIDAIYYGLLSAYIFQVKPKLWKKHASSLFLLGILLFMVLIISFSLFDIKIDNKAYLWNVFYLPICSISIAFTLPVFSQLRSSPKFIIKIITFISVISYSIYLLHYSIVLYSLKIIYPSESLHGLSLWIYTLFYWGITLLLSYLLYKYFEKPFTDLRDSPKLKKFFKISKNE